MDAPDKVTAGIAVVALVISVLSWWASHRAANAAGRTAAVEEERLRLDRQDRAEADLARRESVWSFRRVATDKVEFKFLGPEAHHVYFEANGGLSIELGKYDAGGSMYEGDRRTVQAQDLGAWNERVTVNWAESLAPDAERLRKMYVVGENEASKPAV
jgi:hypothetical protein